MKKTAYLAGILVLLVWAIPALAQGPFADVPTDHWAYEAVNELQMKGIIIGYPDGTFGGKRAMTRYEFAMAISRMIPLIESGLSERIDSLKADVDQLKTKVEGMPKPGGEVPAPQDVSKLATKEDLANVRKLVDEFKDELASLGVDVDALRKDVAALSDRVTKIEEEMAKVKIGFNAQFAGIMPRNRDEDVIAYDLDNRAAVAEADKTQLLENITFVREGDLSLDLKPSSSTSIGLMLAIGNYLPYLSTVDDYVSGARFVNKLGGDNDVVFPYWLYASTKLGGADIQVGRIPLQWTQYTIKKVDVDELLANPITDSGDYPVDGGKIALKLGSVGIEAFAAKNNSNTYVAGLVAEPNGGLFNNTIAPDFGVFHDAGGRQMGGLTQVEQSAGVRLTIGAPMSARLGVSYIQAGQCDPGDYEKADLIGADACLPLGKLRLGAEWAKTKTSGAAGIEDVDDDNQAMDGKLGIDIGKVGINVGYRKIERNFAAPGAWGKLGRWANPVNIRGPYVGLNLSFSKALSIGAVGEFYKGADDFDLMEKKDKIDRVKVDLRFAFTNKTSFGAGWEQVKFKPVGEKNDTDKYITLDLMHKISPDSMIKLGYQIADFNAGEDTGVYGSDFKGDVGYVQVGVKF